MSISFDCYYPKQSTVIIQLDFKIYFWTHFIKWTIIGPKQ